MKWEYSKGHETALVSIRNNSTENMVIPLDLKTIKPYFENQCSMDDYEFSYPILGMTLLVDNRIERIVGKVRNREILDKKDNFAEIVKERQKIYNEYLNSLKKWMKKNKISNIDFAEKNYYLSNHLVIIKAGQQIEFKVVINFDNITNQKNIYYYPINWIEKNESMLSICIDSSIYDYLTEKQRKQLNKYKLFMGHIESNKILL